jgi:hypothetical protein
MIGTLTMIARLVKREVVIVRLEKGPAGIFGEMIIDNLPFAATLEHPTLAIPAGTYLCCITQSPKFGEVYEITEVDGRTHILIHAGNFKEDTSGCVLLGCKTGEIGGVKAVLSSRKKLNEFQSELKSRDFILTIYDLTGEL